MPEPLFGLVAIDPRDHSSRATAPGRPPDLWAHGRALSEETEPFVAASPHYFGRRECALAFRPEGWHDDRVSARDDKTEAAGVLPSRYEAGTRGVNWRHVPPTHGGWPPKESRNMASGGRARPRGGCVGAGRRRRFQDDEAQGQLTRAAPDRAAGLRGTDPGSHSSQAPQARRIHVQARHGEDGRPHRDDRAGQVAGHRARPTKKIGPRRGRSSTRSSIRWRLPGVGRPDVEVPADRSGVMHGWVIRKVRR